MVSAIITTYKRPPEIIRRAAQSVLKQSYKDIELLIVDDSPDTYELRGDVRDMANSLGDNVRYIPHEKNMGACAARNTGIANARGEFVAFLDDDDEWLPEKIERQLNVMKQNDNVVLVYCGRYTYYVSKNIEEQESVEFHEGKVYENLILNNFIGSTSFPLIRKAVLEELGGFNVNMPAAQDFEMWLRIAKEYEVGYVEKPLVRYYVHDGEQITKNHRKKIEALERINEINMEYLERHSKAYSIRILRMLPLYVEFDMPKARTLFVQAVKMYPVPTMDMLRAIKWVYVMPILGRKKG